MSESHSGRLGTDQVSERHLPGGTGEKILTPDDEVDLLIYVINDHTKLIGPVSGAIPDYKITTLLLWMTLLGTGNEVLPPEFLVGHSDP